MSDEKQDVPAGFAREGAQPGQAGVQVGTDAYGRPVYAPPSTVASAAPLYGQAAYGPSGYGQPSGNASFGDAPAGAQPGYGPQGYPGYAPSGPSIYGPQPAQPASVSTKGSAARAAGILVGAALAGGALTLGALVGFRAIDQATGSRIAPPDQASVKTPALPAGGASTSGQDGGAGSSGEAGATPSAQAPGTSATQTDPTAAQSKGVVLIRGTLTNGVSAGSGMVIDPSGLVLTNYHVVQGSTALKVTIASSDKTYTATVVGHDTTHDVALLRLQGASGLDAVTLDDDPVETGDTVTAVGNAQGQGYLSAASGSVTDTSATITVKTDGPSGTETLSDVYETNAGAQPGDSGGPMFDAENEVTGMTTAGEQVSGSRRGGSTSTARTVASYAIPIDKAMAIVKQIESGDSSGSVVVGAKAYLGITVDASSGDPIVASVTAGTPAAKAGIEKGAQITTIAGQSVGSQAEIAAALGKQRAGDAIRIGWTDASGDDHVATVVLAASPVN